MSRESAFEELNLKGFSSRIKYFETSSATVALAAELLGCSCDQIAKTLAVMTHSGPALILTKGTARLDNQKFKYRFSCKAKFLNEEELLQFIGHEPGGVCPFGVKTQVPIFLDESLKGLEDPIYPAAGTAASSVRLSKQELQDLLPGFEWVDVCKDPETT